MQLIITATNNWKRSCPCVCWLFIMTVFRNKLYRLKCSYLFLNFPMVIIEVLSTLITCNLISSQNAQLQICSASSEWNPYLTVSFLLHRLLVNKLFCLSANSETHQRAFFNEIIASFMIQASFNSFRLYFLSLWTQPQQHIWATHWHAAGGWSWWGLLKGCGAWCCLPSLTSTAPQTGYLAHIQTHMHIWTHKREMKDVKRRRVEEM